MSEFFGKIRAAAGPLLVAMILLLAFGTFSVAQEHRYFVNPWSFGVMADTQWTPTSTPTDPAGLNPDTVSASIVTQIDAQFVDHGVKFVFQMGDSANWPTPTTIATSAGLASSYLYGNGVGYFPMRGNHETYMQAFFGIDPTYSVSAIQTDFPQTQGLANTFGAEHFSSPTTVSSDLNGISYSFDYGTPGNDARFVVVDVMATSSQVLPDYSTFIYYGYPIGYQQDWISGRLDQSTRGTQHAFVLSHQPLMGENHYDTPFGGLTNANTNDQNAFFASLQNNNVKYYISAHDHMFQRSIIASPNGTSAVQEIISSPASSKFYLPQSPTNAMWHDQKVRETPLAQELKNIGYYIYTVDGPRVTVDYYSDEQGNYGSDNCFPYGDCTVTPQITSTKITPALNFVKKQTWGYSLNGKEFMVAQGAPYTSVVDNYGETTAQILGGFNNSTAMDVNGRAFTKAVNTGWSSKIGDKLKSDILTLWGMTDLGTDQTDTFVLSLSFDYRENVHLGNGGIGIATVDAQGNWVNAVSKNFGGTQKYVVGPWKDTYGLGTYGVDPSTKTAWAVINYNADFAVANDIEPVPGHRK